MPASRRTFLGVAATGLGEPTDLPPEELGARPDAVGHDLSDLVRFIDRLPADGAR